MEISFGRFHLMSVKHGYPSHLTFENIGRDNIHRDGFNSPMVEKPLHQNSWAKILGQALKTSIRISLDETRPPPKETRGILLYSHGSSFLVEDSPKRPETAHTEEHKMDSSTLKATMGESADKNTPNNHLATQSTSSSTLHPESTQKKKEHVPRTDHSDKHQEIGKLSNSFHVFTWLNEARSTSLSTSSPLSPSNDPNQDRAGGDNHVDSSFILDEMNLRADLKEIDRFLKRCTSFEERLIYHECPQRSRSEVYTLLKKDEKEIAGLKEKDPKQTKAYEDKVAIVNKVDMLFQFFLPPNFEGRTIGKYWGAVYRLLVSLSPDKPRAFLRELAATEVLRWLNYTARTAQFFREVCSGASSTERSAIELPEEFPKAWLHLLMALIISSKEEHMAGFRNQSEKSFELLKEGTRKVAESLQTKNLLEYAVFKPWELASLINFVLLGDITAQSRDTSDTYLDYLNYLETAVEANPLDRGHQDKLTAFKQEISVILETLMQQRLILSYAEQGSTAAQPSAVVTPARFETSHASPSNLTVPPRHPSSSRPEPTFNSRSYTRSYARADPVHDSTYSRDLPDAYYDESPYPRQSTGPYVGRPRTPGSRIDPTDPAGIQGLLLQDSYALIDRKMRQFQEMNNRASELETWNTLKIDYNKDRQESAIYAFTIVTIIFLPLSTVASILGMNVNDVRNMEIDQWVFWATALPLSVIVITLCLIWAGELENFWRGFRNLWVGSNRRRGAQGGYSMLNPRSDAYSMMYQEADLGRIPAPLPRIINNRTEYEDVDRYRPLYGRSRSRAYDDDAW